MISCVFACFLTLVIVSPTLASHLHEENWYQAQWCEENKGEEEVVLPDQTRADCITKTHAVEVEFAKKWEESIGQSLFYSLQTDKHAGVVLIIETSDDMRYWFRLNSVIQHFKLPIDAWMVGKGIPK